MSFRKHSRGYWLLMLLAAGIALACGPEFPYRSVLNDRPSSRLEAPAHSFSGTMQHLVPVENAAFKVSEDGIDVEEWEQTHLPADQRQRVAAMRRQVTAEAALKEGEGLPSAVRHYVAGAAAYWRFVDKAFPASAANARQQFDAVLSMPRKEGYSRAAWAAWALARLDRHASADASALENFARVRMLVADGAEDPLGLAVASYGEEAGIHLARGDISAAVRLYAIQAAHGSESARNSLLRVAPRLMDDPLKDPLLQSLALSYALEIAEGELFDITEIERSEAAEEAESETEAQNMHVEVSSGTEELDNEEIQAVASHQQEPSSVLGKVLERIAALPDDAISDPEAVSVAAYRAGQYELAGTQARNAISRGTAPLAFIVLAKLSLRQGDSSAVDGHYSNAVTALRTIASAPTPMAQHDQSETLSRTLAEWAAFSVAKGMYQEALHQFLDVGPSAWVDAVYLAEQVLSTDELKAVVDARNDNVDAPLDVWRQAFSSDGEAQYEESLSTDAENAVRNPCPAGPPCKDAPIRDVLARRLMREGRIADAIEYFSDRRLESEPDGDATRDESIRNAALRYKRARDHASTKWIKARRAASLYEAAIIEKELGMELFGYEGSPDGAMFGGFFPPEEIVPRASSADGFGPDEATRVLSSAPAAPHRYHFIFRAAATGEAAADILPPRSQAYAAVLCEATSWVIDHDEERATQLYRRYLSHGAYVAWGNRFGRQCPVPEFGNAFKMQLLADLQARYPFIKQHPYRTTVLIVLTGLVLITLFILGVRTIVSSKRARTGPASLP